MTNSKLQKLINLYNDKTITLEEKRSIAVKIADIYINTETRKSDKIRYFIDGLPKEVDLYECFELYKEKHNELVQSQIRESRLERSLVNLSDQFKREMHRNNRRTFIVVTTILIILLIFK